MRVQGKQRFHRVPRAVSRFYAENSVMQFPPSIAAAIGAAHPRPDPFLLEREPLRVSNSGWNGRPIISLDDHYSAEDEVRGDEAPYLGFARALNHAGLLARVSSVLDVGCASGRLLEAVLKLLPVDSTVKAQGIDLFGFHGASQWFPQNASFHQLDLRLPVRVGGDVEPAELVICTEVGEHIDPASLDVFMENLVTLTSSQLVLTWSGTYPPKNAPPQHLSPLNNRQTRRLLEFYGFRQSRKASKNLLRGLKREKHAYFWWRESLSVWSRN